MTNEAFFEHAIAIFVLLRTFYYLFKELYQVLVDAALVVRI